jgi:hypothetical protein
METLENNINALAEITTIALSIVESSTGMPVTDELIDKTNAVVVESVKKHYADKGQDFDIATTVIEPTALVEALTSVIAIAKAALLSAALKFM